MIAVVQVVRFDCVRRGMRLLWRVESQRRLVGGFFDLEDPRIDVGGLESNAEDGGGTYF
jgi:hypothetical protein